MNTLLKKAGIPQMRCKAMTGGKSPASFSYEARLPGQMDFNNYQYVLPRVDVVAFWQKLNDLAHTGGARG
ncbi:hypothetical protein H8S21_10735 [Erwinia persicina]|uniref:hypothetical protein n=1 Tax=Erwinia persicina TaxID=55211 RepID=UPI000786CEDA|nr:hypothetical protein [Erwinia persicina]MBC3945800.1 hypothetical protein [Erwinia persicina]MCQ4105190.1 hypothetical protein [Erwinia persicina]UTX11402.1 hypothetical protein NOG67_13455 [Erwinia persicina]